MALGYSVAYLSYALEKFMTILVEDTTTILGEIIAPIKIQFSF